MTNSDFCKKVTKMMGSSVELVEVERDCFQAKVRNIWMSGDQSVIFSDDFSKWVGAFAWHAFNKRVVWDNINKSFWFEEVKVGEA